MAKGIVTFREDICKGCGLCTTACPVKIIELSKTKINKKGFYPAGLTDPEKCVGCGNCAMMCPDSVISVERL